MPLPTLPTEMVKHTLELLYEDVRALEPYSPHPPFGLFDGEHVAFVFKPLFLVSKIFYALSLPIAVRHLLNTARPTPTKEHALDVKHVVKLLKRRSAGQAVQSLALNPSTVSESRQLALVGVCTRLRKIHLFNQLDFSLLPATIDTLILQARGTLGATALSAMSKALPNLKHLALEGGWKQKMRRRLELVVERGRPPVFGHWKLASLSLRCLAGSQAQLLVLIIEAAPTLTTLFVRDIKTLPITDTFPPPRIDYTLLSAIPCSLPVLKTLRSFVGSHPSPGVQVVSHSSAPFLEVVEISLSDRTIPLLLDVSPTLKRALLFLDRADFGAGTNATATLMSFVQTHPALELLSLELGDFIGVDERDYCAELVELCAERGVELVGAGLPTRNLVPPPAEESAGSDVDASSAGSDAECRLGSDADFDAEEDLLWSRHWTQKKREAMGLSEPIGFQSVASVSRRQLTSSLSSRRD